MTDLAQLDPALTRPAPRIAARAARPSAVVVVTAPAGTVPLLGSCLAALARSEGLAGLRVMPGSLAVLVLAAEDAARVAVEGLAPGYPFPLRVEVGAELTRRAADRGAAWAAALEMPEAPVLLLDARRRVAPGWAYAALAALRDGADIVRGRATLRDRLGLGVRPALALRAGADRPWWRLRRAVV